MTKTDVCNAALDILGADPLADVANDHSQAAKRIRRLYATAARKILVAIEPQSSIERVYLTYESNDDNYYNNQYEYIYDLPSDCLKVLDIDMDPEIDRFVEGDYLYMNLHDVTNEGLTVASVTSNAIVAVEDIDVDVLAAGKVEINIDDEDDEWKTYSYTSWSSKTFSGVTPDPSADVAAADVMRSASDGNVLRYVKDIREESGGVVLYEEHVAWAISRELAVMLAPSYEKTNEDVRMLEGLAEEALLDAKDDDNAEANSVPEQEEPWV